MLKSVLREGMLFGACAVFTAVVGLILLDTVIMPRVVRKGMQVEVPDIVNLSPVQARQKLASYGLHLQLEEPRWDASVPEGQLVSQHPAAFSHVKPNRTIYAVPSRGSRLYNVPDLQGKTLRQARLVVEQGGLMMGDVTEDSSETVPEGQVIRQDPPAGRSVTMNTPVSLVMSSGPPRKMLAMPNLVGQSLDDARSSLSGLELTVGDIQYQSSTSYMPNVVIQQIPAAGDSVKQGSPVHLVISKL